MDVAIELIAERGVRSFSLAEASRRLGVTVAAPYRHFADRDDLIAAVAVRAVHAFARALTAEVDETQPAGQRLAAMTRGYVRFAAGQRPLFDTVYGSGLDKNRYPDLKAAFESVEQAFGACVRDICGSRPRRRRRAGDGAGSDGPRPRDAAPGRGLRCGSRRGAHGGRPGGPGHVRPDRGAPGTPSRLRRLKMAPRTYR